jgi:hypothetical protein
LPRHLRFLDCQEVAQLKAPPIKVLQKHLRREDPGLKKLSRQKIADTLEIFGVQRSNPRQSRWSAPISP